MKKQLVTTFILMALPFIFGSCISSILKDSPPTFSSEIKITSPRKPFVKTEASVFPSWRSTTTGNVIAIVSDCNANSSYNLSNLYLLLENSLENVKIIKEETLTLQKNPALLRVVSALLDGYPIEIHSISFKKRSCGYVASLSGKENNLSTDKIQFESFIDGFSFE